MKTVKVRVAVAVDETGAWNGDGYYELSDEQATRLALDSLRGGTKSLYFLTAELPIPEVQEVAASVEKV